MVPNWVVFCEVVCDIFLTLLPEYAEVVLSDFITHPIKSHINCYGFVSCLSYLQCDLLQNCMLPLVLVVVGGPFILGRFTLRWPFDSFQIFFTVQVLWWSPWCCESYCIWRVLAHYLDTFLRLVFFLVVVLGKSIFQIYYMPLVLRGENHLNKGLWSYHFSCNPLQHLDVMRINLRNGRSVFLSPRWILSELPPGSSVPSSWCSKLLLHSKVMCPLSYIGVSD